jgi:hypothetical protein|tara:strand:+ start:143 stop:580 length:438 start_codon:yes stop_codon:yes gene_type:complete
MSEENLELTVDQQSEIRALLGSFAKSKTSHRQTKNSKHFSEIDIDIIEEAEPGTMVHWNDLTAKTRRYTFVRESRATFVPYILDRIPIKLETLSDLCEFIGMQVTTQQINNTVCAIEMAEPIRILQLETLPEKDKIIITNMIYIM